MLFEEQDALSLTDRAHIDAFPLLMKDTSLLRFCTAATRFNCSFSEASPLTGSSHTVLLLGFSKDMFTAFTESPGEFAVSC